LFNKTLYIDGDAFPNLLKPIILKAIERLQIKTLVIANKKINIGNSKLIEYIIVEQGADEADNRIVEMVEIGDLVITADIPLADRVISKQYLAIRNLMQDIRDSGEMTKGPAAFSQKDAQQFANSLNNFLQR
jgi:uncharacterized protein